MDPTGCPGDAVVLLGSSNALRNWDAANAIQLQQLRPLDRSWWSAVVDEAVGTEIEFKFAVRSITTGALTWEELKENRAFVIPDQRNPVLSCVFAEPPIYLSFDHSDLPSTAGFGSLVPRVSSDVARAAAHAAGGCSCPEELMLLCWMHISSAPRAAVTPIEMQGESNLEGWFSPSTWIRCKCWAVDTTPGDHC